ncbi:Prophage ps1 protein 04 [Lactococcus chungangensis CAU 28 = DSM 22330]|uniref:Prophage ps1 protein 04 n=1 Tax=Pseudolactococcus chungangensis CAU 28 = DSM 22330 TaxID=1122154 RepID=A0A1K2HI04_9LACT|nr:hypothetical protein [Lactococcus chungangensis]PCS01202.1 Prophage ps1 protein 04 [Lactococcus chungangensis CAU 28 = DSM 22330]SFZ76452.1 hypothetical protein SAMN02746068_01956 [Lactococcus chungangensis CAU 28 = DSM 22330]
MTNTKKETMNVETETHLKLAGALNVIAKLFSNLYPHLTAEERYEYFNKSLGELCDSLGVDLDMFEHYQQGDITLENYEDLRKLDEEESSRFISDEVEQDEPNSVVTVADELEELYALNDSMFTSDPNHVPTYTDGTVIRQQDLADMNMNGLQRIAEMIGIELGE